VGELIAIPLSSERRAALLLAALRHLESEYQVSQPASDGTPGWLSRGARRRRMLSGARACLKDGLVGGVLGTMLAAVWAIWAVWTGTSRGRPWEGSLAGLSEVTPLVLALGLTLGALAGVVWSLSRKALSLWRRERARRRCAPEAGGLADHVSWLVAYLTLERDESGCSRLHTTVVRLSLPAEAEGRLRAALARAAATSAV
jgi:hypothetical protein